MTYIYKGWIPGEISARTEYRVCDGILERKKGDDGDSYYFMRPLLLEDVKGYVDQKVLGAPADQIFSRKRGVSDYIVGLGEYHINKNVIEDLYEDDEDDEDAHTLQANRTAQELVPANAGGVAGGGVIVPADFTKMFANGVGNVTLVQVASGATYQPFANVAVNGDTSATDKKVAKLTKEMEDLKGGHEDLKGEHEDLAKKHIRLDGHVKTLSEQKPRAPSSFDRKDYDPTDLHGRLSISNTATTPKKKKPGSTDKLPDDEDEFGTPKEGEEDTDMSPIVESKEEEEDDDEDDDNARNDNDILAPSTPPPAYASLPGASIASTSEPEASDSVIGSAFRAVRGIFSVKKKVEKKPAPATLPKQEDALMDFVDVFGCILDDDDDVDVKAAPKEEEELDDLDASVVVDVIDHPIEGATMEVAHGNDDREEATVEPFEICQVNAPSGGKEAVAKLAGLFEDAALEVGGEDVEAANVGGTIEAATDDEGAIAADNQGSKHKENAVVPFEGMASKDTGVPPAAEDVAPEQGEEDLDDEEETADLGTLVETVDEESDTETVLDVAQVDDNDNETGLGTVEDVANVKVEGEDEEEQEGVLFDAAAVAFADLNAVGEVDDNAVADDNISEDDCDQSDVENCPPKRKMAKAEKADARARAKAAMDPNGGGLDVSLVGEAAPHGVVNLSAAEGEEAAAETGVHLPLYHPLTKKGNPCKKCKPYESPPTYCHQHEAQARAYNNNSSIEY